MPRRLRTLNFRILIVVMLSCFTSFAYGQESTGNAAASSGPTTEDGVSVPDAELLKVIEALSAKVEELEAAKAVGYLAAQERYYKAEIEYMEFQEELRAHTISVLAWQKFASYVILALVVFITALGGLLAYREVMKAIELGLPKESSMELAAHRFQITSAVTGVVILVLSLFFLLLFVERVFQLNPTNLAAGESLAGGVPDEAPRDEGGAKEAQQ
ncbi:MAG: hypothetical protein V4583_10460 [Pseudomonadota bacterium]